MKKLLYLVLILGIFFSCRNRSAEEMALFKGAQPIGVKNLKSIPNKIWGDFVSKEGAIKVVVSKNTIIRIEDYDLKYQRDSLLKEGKLIGNSLFEYGSDTFRIIVVNQDSITLRYTKSDTIFNLSNENVIKKYKGYYFLNYLADSDYWSVDKLELRKGVLSISYISTDEELKNLRQIVETPNDSISRKFNLTRKQFKTFLKNDGFKTGELYFKVKK